MNAFTQTMIDIIRSIDPRRPISSGMSAPRPGAWHMEHCELHGCPAGAVGSKSFWGPDTRDQWMEALTEQQRGADFWSIHLYDEAPGPGRCYFSPDQETCAPLIDVIQAAGVAASRAGAALYLGEFGGPKPDFTGPSEQNQTFPAAALELQVAQATNEGMYSRLYILVVTRRSRLL
jgi:RimJ/RimL family protein N-acetyltransferase